MLKQTFTALLLILCLILTGCGAEKAVSPSPSAEQKSAVSKGSEDPAGLPAKIAEAFADGAPKRVVSMQTSLADIWQTVGGTVAGVPADAFERADLKFEGAVSIGTTKAPSVERIIDLAPDLVLYSPDIAGQLEAAKLLEECGILTLAAKEDSFSEYLANLRTFSALMKNEEAYSEFGEDVEKEIERICGDAAEKLKTLEAPPTALFLRAFSSDCKVKAKGHIVCDMLSDLGVVNIADTDNSLLENLSMERVYDLDPDYILIVFMGDDRDAAERNLSETMYSSPVWSELSAVKNDKLIYLPTELFHYKPNSRWAKSYEFLYEQIYEDR